MDIRGVIGRILILNIIGCVRYVTSFPGGAPSGQCVSMTPSHGSSARTDPPPYSLALSNSSYNPEDEITFTLTANSGSFKGYLLQVRQSDDALVGSFVAPSDGQQVCTSGRTHTGNTIKTTQSFTWKAPASKSGDLKAVVTIVQEKTIYWVKKTLATITEEQPTTTNSADTTSTAVQSTTQAASDTTQAASDTTQAASDTTQAASDTTQAASDTTQAASDTTQAASDTTQAASDTTPVSAGGSSTSATGDTSTSASVDTSTSASQSSSASSLAGTSTSAPGGTSAPVSVSTTASSTDPAIKAEKKSDALKSVDIVIIVVTCVVAGLLLIGVFVLCIHHRILKTQERDERKYRIPYEPHLEKTTDFERADVVSSGTGGTASTINYQDWMEEVKTEL